MYWRLTCPHSEDLRSERNPSFEPNSLLPVMLSIRSIWSATGIRNLTGLRGLAVTETGARPTISLTRALDSSGCLQLCSQLESYGDVFLLVAHDEECRCSHGVPDIDDLLACNVLHVLQHCRQVILTHLVPTELPETVLPDSNYSSINVESNILLR